MFTPLCLASRLTPLRGQRRSILRPICITLITSLCCTTMSYAENNPRYEAAIRQAESEIGQGKFKEAAESMRRALTIQAKPAMLFDIAELYERAQEWRDSLKFFQRFIDEAPGDQRVPEAINRIRGLQSRLKSQYEEVMISSQPSGAYLYINDRANGSVGQTPHRMKLLPGTYEIIAELDGYVPASQTLKLQEGASSQVAISLYSEAEVAPVRFMINRPGAQVYVDRRLRGESPMLEPILIRQGVRELRVTKPGYNPWIKNVTVKPQEPLTVDIVLVEAGREEFNKPVQEETSYTPWVVMGAGAAMIGGGIFTGISAQSLYTELESRRDKELLIASQDIDVGNQWVLMTNVLLGLGITSLTTGGVLWMLEPEPKAKAPDGPNLQGTTGVMGHLNADPFASSVIDPLQALSSPSSTEFSKGDR